MDFINSLTPLQVAAIMVAASVVYNTFVQALPGPDRLSGKLYIFFFRFCHGFAKNWKVAFKDFDAKVRR